MIPVTAATAGRELQSLHLERGISRTKLAKLMARRSTLDHHTVEERLRKWAAGDRSPNMATYEQALAALGMRLAIVPIEEPAPEVPCASNHGAPAESLAEKFHETYERLAPDFGYRTREASAKPWAEVPADNKALMVAVAAEILGAHKSDHGAIVGPAGSAHVCGSPAGCWADPDCPVYSSRKRTDDTKKSHYGATPCCDAEPGQPHTGECTGDLTREVCPGCGLWDCDAHKYRKAQHKSDRGAIVGPAGSAHGVPDFREE